ncbi:hypothetical protein ACTXT7_011140 [Hymenolepis weldensis]
MHRYYLIPRNPGTPLVPNRPPPPDWQMGGQSTMVDGGLFEFCLPPPYQSQFMPVRPLLPGLEPFWAVNGSIVFVDQTTKTFYTPEQVPMQLISRQPQVPTVFSPTTGVRPMQHLFEQYSNSAYSVPTQVLLGNWTNWHH